MNRASGDHGTPLPMVGRTTFCAGEPQVLAKIAAKVEILGTILGPKRALSCGTKGKCYKSRKIWRKTGEDTKRALS